MSALIIQSFVYDHFESERVSSIMLISMHLVRNKILHHANDKRFYIKQSERMSCNKINLKHLRLTSYEESHGVEARAVLELLQQEDLLKLDYSIGFPTTKF